MGDRVSLLFSPWWSKHDIHLISPKRFNKCQTLQPTFQVVKLHFRVFPMWCDVGCKAWLGTEPQADPAALAPERAGHCCLDSLADKHSFHMGCLTEGPLHTTQAQLWQGQRREQGPKLHHAHPDMLGGMQHDRAVNRDGGRHLHLSLWGSFVHLLRNGCYSLHVRMQVTLGKIFHIFRERSINSLAWKHNFFLPPPLPLASNSFKLIKNTWLA